MKKSYRAVIQGDRIDWVDQPPELGVVREVEVLVEEPQQDNQADRRRRAGELMRELSRANPFAGIADPVAWQREVRQDRPLPAREQHE